MSELAFHLLFFAAIAVVAGCSGAATAYALILHELSKGPGIPPKPGPHGSPIGRHTRDPNEQKRKCKNAQ